MRQSGTEERSESKSMADVIISSPLVKSFLAGSLSGTFSTLLFQPLDLLKTRLQQPQISGETSRVGMLKHVVHVVKNERVFGLWKGTVPSIVRCVPGVGLYFCTLHFLKTSLHLDNPSSSEAMFLGASARSIAGVVLLPVTVIKTRFESEVYHYRTMSEATRDIYRTNGLRGLYSGLIPTLVRDAPYSGIYLVFYVQAKRFVPERVREGSHLVAANFTCGVVAGLLASLVTQPADVIKTHMQLQPGKFRSILTSILLIAKEEGMVGYFRGLVPRMLRRTLVTAMAWSFYEQVTKGFIKK
ncbi:mitochondrial glycine transporter A-like isoform X1 [Dermacentor andersoni]|uniref:mitochondrial glycine transporter A-like isoform X1 n=1 Tax=Dermacentor andersoni TaxID=34620 RepID=UPI003B3B4260